jgi:hypothetical protein
MPRKHGLDRSTMFTNLLELSSVYGQLPRSHGEQITTVALAAWYDSTASDMFAFTKEWIKKERKDLLPLKPAYR